VRDKTDVAVQVRSRLVVNNVESACDTACAGIGITPAFSYHVTATLQATTLTTLLEEFQPPPLPVHIVYQLSYAHSLISRPRAPRRGCVTGAKRPWRNVHVRYSFAASDTLGPEPPEALETGPSALLKTRRSVARDYDPEIFAQGVYFGRAMETARSFARSPTHSVSPAGSMAVGCLRPSSRVVTVA